MRVAVVGSGVLGQALTRSLHGRGVAVTVLSPRAAELPAMWMRCDAVTGEGLRRGIAGAAVVVYTAAASAGPAVEEVARVGARHAATAAGQAGARFVLVGPAGAGPKAMAASLRAHHAATGVCRQIHPEARVIRVPPLFGEGDRLLSPWLAQVRRGRSLRVAGGDLQLRPLRLQDAVRVVEEAIEARLPPGVVSLNGPEAHSVAGLAALVCDRLGARRAWIPWGGPSPRPEERARLPEQLDAPDDWARLELGERGTVAGFLERWAQRHR